MKIEELHRFEDIHTHVKAGAKSICSLPPREAIALSHTDENQPFSIELHPWYASEELLEEFLEACEICCNDPRFVAIGECGLDRICNTDMEIQKKCFRQALFCAKRFQKPVIMHIVKAWEEMFGIVKEFWPLPLAPNTEADAPLLIIHGFRKNPTMAKQLIDQGFYISLGGYYNKEILTAIPKDRIFYETDYSK